MQRLLALFGAAGLAGSAGAAMPGAAVTPPERAALEARVAQARRQLADAAPAARSHDANAGTLASEVAAWNNWPNWSNWANWANG